MIWLVLNGSAWAQASPDMEQIGIRNINPDSPGLLTTGIDAEILIGKAEARMFEQNVQLSANPTLRSLVERVGQTLARNSDLRLPLTIRVIVPDERNVFAFPGGWMYVTTGLIRAASTESELAAALSQGIAHVAARHAVERHGRAAFSPGLGVFSRAETREADLLGIQYLYKAGYDPAAAIRMLQTLEIQSRVGGSISSFPVFNSYMPIVDSQTHPPVSSRVENLERAMSTFPSGPEVVLTSSEFVQMRTQLSR
jgi:predicted Zn-dependent protease